MLVEISFDANDDEYFSGFELNGGIGESRFTEREKTALETKQ